MVIFFFSIKYVFLEFVYRVLKIFYIYREKKEVGFYFCKNDIYSLRLDVYQWRVYSFEYLVKCCE